MMKLRMTALFLSVFLLLAGGFSAQAASLSKEELYEASLNQLKAYLDGDAGMPLDALIENFDGLGRYKMSIDLSFYARILRDVEKNDFSDVALYISMLKMDPDLPAFLEEHQMGSLEELENYAMARECQFKGKKSEAVEYYSHCMGFMDSMIRYRQLRPGVDEEMSKVTPTPTPKKNYNYTSSNKATPKPVATPKPAATPCPHASTYEKEGERESIGGKDWILEVKEICNKCGTVVDSWYKAGIYADITVPVTTPCPHASTREVAGEREYSGPHDWIQEVKEICNKCGAVVDSWYNGGSVEDIIIPSNNNSWEYDDDGEAAKPID